MVRSREPGLDHDDFGHDDPRSDDADTPGSHSGGSPTSRKGQPLPIVACTKSMSASMPSTLVNMVRKRNRNRTSRGSSSRRRDVDR